MHIICPMMPYEPFSSQSPKKVASKAARNKPKKPLPSGLFSQKIPPCPASLPRRSTDRLGFG